MEDKMTTKDKIVFESLRLFSTHGYDGVSMRDIATAVGIKGASIYSHFKGKEDIFNGIFSEMTNQYDNVAAMMNIPMEENDDTTFVYHNVNEKELLNMAEGLFEFFTKNEFVVMFRKLLVTEQHKAPIAAKYYKEYYLEAPIFFQSQLFRSLQLKGDFENYDAKTMALHFYSPVYYILSRFDLGYSYEKCLEELKSHVHYFCKIYVK